MSNYYKRNKKNKIIFNIQCMLILSLLLFSTKYIKDKNYNTIVIFSIIIYLLFLVSKIVYLYIKKIKKKRFYINSDIRKIDIMTGEEFEEYLKIHFQKQGYKVFLTPKTNDYGADLILLKNDEKIVVQTKRYRNKVSNNAIQEVVGSIGYYNANKSMVITNSFFTKNALELAKANNVELWDRNKLIKIFKIK